MSDDVIDCCKPEHADDEGFVGRRAGDLTVW